MDGCRIKLITKQQFSQLREEHNMLQLPLISGDPYRAKNIVRRQGQASTERAYSCNAGGLQNGKQVTLFHLDPDATAGLDEQNKIWSILSEDAVELKKAGPTRGFITGGQVEDKESNALHRTLGNIMKRSGIRHISQVWGRRDFKADGPTNVIYHAPKNTWYVNAQLDHERSRDVLTIGDLQKTFKKIHLATGDTLETADGVFTSENLPDGMFQKVGGKLFAKVSQTIR